MGLFDLAPSAIDALCINAGMSDPAKRTNAIAIALAESSGNPHAVNGQFTGLWQIGYQVHKDLGYSQDQLKDPAVNAAAMMKVSSGGTNWKPWTTYTNGAYKAHLQTAQKVAYGQGSGNPMNTAPPTGIQSPGQTIGDAAKEATGIPGAIDKINQTLRNDFLLAMPIGIALVLIVLGVLILGRKGIGGAAVKAARVAVLK